MSDDYTIVGYGNRGFVTIPQPIVVEFPEGRFATAKEVADALFTIDDTAYPDDQELSIEAFAGTLPIACFGVPYQPFETGSRYDVTAFRLVDGVQLQLEITSRWVRVYLHPAIRGATTRDELEGQELQGREILDDICVVTGGEVMP